MTDLNAKLLRAHAAEDTARLARLYTLAADRANGVDAMAFYLTHAHVFALEAGSSQANILRQRLIDMGRETPL